MRTIKFRGKRIDTGAFVYGDLIHRNDGDVAIYTNLDTWGENPDDVDAYGDSFRVSKSTIGQFTGLHDNNGREIYEGDILKGAWDTIFQVFYDDCYLGFRAKEKGGMENCIDYYGLERIEVIGNIHDNPELLKQQEL